MARARPASSKPVGIDEADASHFLQHDGESSCPCNQLGHNSLISSAFGLMSTSPGAANQI